MSHKRVIVELAPSRLRLAVFEGRSRVQAREVVLDAAQESGDWAGAIRAASPRLRESVTQAGCAGSLATAIYAGSGTVCTTASCPASTGPAAAENAARLALASLSGSPIGASQIELCPIGVDISGGVTAAGDAAPPQRHTLAVAESEDALIALSRCLADAGLRPAALLPIEALAIVDVARAVSASPAPVVVLWVGDQLCVLAAGSASRLCFVRTVAAGLDSLVDALTRSLRPRNGGDAPRAPLTRSEARNVLLAVGIPGRDQAIPGMPDLDGSSLLPHLQPVLQRVSIELKQSLRFGVAEPERADLGLRLIGPGAGIPALASSLARLAGLGEAPPEQPAPADPIETVATGACPLDGLLPRDLRERLTTGRLRKALVAGVGAAALLVGYQAYSTRARLATAQTELAALRATAEQDRIAAELTRRALDARAAFSALETRVRSTVGDTPAAAALLSLLAERIPAAVRIASIDVTTDGPAPVCHVRGHVLLDQAENAPAAIRSFLDALSTAPIISDVRLGATQRSNAHGRDVQSFELSLGLVPLPAGPAPLAAAPAPETHP